jgi:hypothetical protein
MQMTSTLPQLLHAFFQDWLIHSAVLPRTP